MKRILLLPLGLVPFLLSSCDGGSSPTAGEPPAVKPAAEQSITQMLYSIDDDPKIFASDPLLIEAAKPDEIKGVVGGNRNDPFRTIASPQVKVISLKPTAPAPKKVFGAGVTKGSANTKIASRLPSPPPPLKPLKPVAPPLLTDNLKISGLIDLQGEIFIMIQEYDRPVRTVKVGETLFDGKVKIVTADVERSSITLSDGDQLVTRSVSPGA